MIFISLVLNCVAGSITKERSRPSLRGGFDLKQGLRKLRLIAAFNLMQKYAGEGVNLEEARKRNKLIDSVVRDFTDRNNNNMGKLTGGNCISGRCKEFFHLKNLEDLYTFRWRQKRF